MDKEQWQLDNQNLDNMRREIDQFDDDIIRLIRARTFISNAIGKARTSSGGAPIDEGREVAINSRYEDQLGPAGLKIAEALLELGRGVR